MEKTVTIQGRPVTNISTSNSYQANSKYICFTCFATVQNVMLKITYLHIYIYIYIYIYIFTGIFRLPDLSKIDFDPYFNV